MVGSFYQISVAFGKWKSFNFLRDLLVIINLMKEIRRVTRLSAGGSVALTLPACPFPSLHN
jgi:hypothetical protein